MDDDKQNEVVREDSNERPVVDPGSDQSYLFFNKKYRQFVVTGENRTFEFQKGYLRVNAEDRAEFLAIVKDPKFPRSESIQIVEINEEARAQAEVSVLDQTNPNGGVMSKAAGNGPGVIRGPMAAADIQTSKDQQNLARPSTPSGSNLSPPAGAPKPAFQLPGSFGGNKS